MMKKTRNRNWSAILTLLLGLSAFACEQNKEKQTRSEIPPQDTTVYMRPLVSHIFTADPSAHVFNDRIYIYPSHDIDAGTPENDNGDHFDMRDYHVFSMDQVGGEVIDHGKVLDVSDVPWAARQMWAPDAAFANDHYYLYFPAKDDQDIFRIGVAVSDSPSGPFIPEQEPIAGSYSIDPAIFKDTDGAHYMYFGGIWGGQLHQYDANTFLPEADLRQPQQIAALPRVAKMADDMLSFAEAPREVLLLDENGEPFTEAQNEKRFFEAAWVHVYKDVYYFSYSTGDTHLICYATGDSPYGPFTYQGVILKPVQGWTTHHSIVAHNGDWFLFYHDVELSGKTYLRNIKVVPLTHLEDGSITSIIPQP